MDEFEDPVLRDALRDHVARTRPSLDVGQAFASVRRRAHRRRIRNGVATGVGGAAAVTTLALGVVALTGEQDVVRTPATQPSDTGMVTPPSTQDSTGTVAPTSSQTTTTTNRTTTTTATSTTDETRPSTTGMTASPITEQFMSAGGSITVRAVNRRVSLVGSPMTEYGYTARIEDDGPDRVRVRFESAAGDAEIRVELVGGRLVPTITNPVGSGSGSGSDSGSGSGTSGSGSDSGSGSGSSGSGSDSGSGSGSSGSGSGSSGHSGSGSSGSNSGPGSGTSGSGSSGSSSGSGSASSGSGSGD